MHRILGSLVLAAVLAAAACTATKAGKAEDIKFSGFLSTYSGLEATDDSEKASFRYVKPGIDLSRYNQILLDRPEARMSAEALKSMGDDDLAYVLGTLDKTMRDAVGARWMTASEPGPAVLRIRLCLSDADAATAVLTPFNRVLPVGFLISKGAQLATGTGINVGKVTGEMEILDSVTGERQFAAVDRRVGTGVTREILTSWGDVEQAFTLWSERLVERLPEFGMPAKSFR